MYSLLSIMYNFIVHPPQKNQAFRGLTFVCGICYDLVNKSEKKNSNISVITKRVSVWWKLIYKLI